MTSWRKSCCTFDRNIFSRPNAFGGELEDLNGLRKPYCSTCRKRAFRQCAFECDLGATTALKMLFHKCYICRVTCVSWCASWGRPTTRTLYRNIYNWRIFADHRPPHSGTDGAWIIRRMSSNFYHNPGTGVVHLDAAFLRDLRLMPMVVVAMSWMN